MTSFCKSKLKRSIILAALISVMSNSVIAQSGTGITFLQAQMCIEQSHKIEKLSRGFSSAQDGISRAAERQATNIYQLLKDPTKLAAMDSINGSRWREKTTDIGYNVVTNISDSLEGLLPSYLLMRALEEVPGAAPYIEGINNGGAITQFLTRQMDRTSVLTYAAFGVRFVGMLEGWNTVSEPEVTKAPGNLRKFAAALREQCRLEYLGE